MTGVQTAPEQALSATQDPLCINTEKRPEGDNKAYIRHNSAGLYHRRLCTAARQAVLQAPTPSALFLGAR